MQPRYLLTLMAAVETLGTSLYVYGTLLLWRQIFLLGDVSAFTSERFGPKHKARRGCGAPQE